MFESPERSLVNYDQERGQHIILQNAKLKVDLRQLKVSQFQSRKSRTWGAELGAAIRNVVRRVHRTAPSLEGQSISVIEARLKEEEDDILKQLHTPGEPSGAWRTPDPP